MSLSDTAKDLQQQAASPELRWLREMRAFVKKNTKETIMAELEKIEDYSKTPEGSSPKEQEKVYAMTVKVLERAHLADFYARALKYAEIKERQEKGGGEKAIKAHRQEIEKMERNLKKKYKRESRLQVSLDDMEEGEADGNNEKGYDPFAAADGE